MSRLRAVLAFAATAILLVAALATGVALAQRRTDAGDAAARPTPTPAATALPTPTASPHLVSTTPAPPSPTSAASPRPSETPLAYPRGGYLSPDRRYAANIVWTGTPHVYRVYFADTSGRVIATHDGDAETILGWLPDSSGVVVLTAPSATRFGETQYGLVRLDGAAVALPLGDITWLNTAHATSDGKWLAALVAAHCCGATGTEIRVTDRDGTVSKLIAKGDGLRFEGWDLDQRVLYQIGPSGGPLYAVSLDGRTETLSLPAELASIPLGPGAASPDGTARLFVRHLDDTNGHIGVPVALYAGGVWRTVALDWFLGWHGDHDVVAIQGNAVVRVDPFTGTVREVTTPRDPWIRTLMVGGTQGNVADWQVSLPALGNVALSRGIPDDLATLVAAAR